MLFQDTLFGMVDKVQRSINRLRAFEPEEGYYLAFSGGKDSQCVYHLAKLAGVRFEAHYSVTTIDPPELMRFIRDAYPDVVWDHPVDSSGSPTSMWKIIAEHPTPPTRANRYCCATLKEPQGKGRVVVTGVRWAESINRRETHGVADIITSSKRLIKAQLSNNPAAETNRHGSLVLMDDNDESKRVVDQCFKKNKTVINPIIDWDDTDVWEFLNEVVAVQHCSLYDEGFLRIGCVGCPLQGKKGMLRGFERWPRYRELYIAAFAKMLENNEHFTQTALGNQVKTNGDISKMDAERVFEDWIAWSR